MLGGVEAEVAENAFRVKRTRVRSMILWLNDSLIDWAKPISVKVNGQVEFSGTVAPNLLLCLTQAAESYDFDRLRWAGVRFESGKKGRVVTP